MRRILAGLAASLFVVGGVAPTAQADAIPDGTTVVTFTFDDTFEDQVAAFDVLEKHGFNATIYSNSPRIGEENYATLRQLRRYQRNGFEIGGHTLDHVDLAKASETKLRKQVCDDRATLTKLGFRVTSFAYPFGANDDLAREVVKDCGYNSARSLPGLRSPGFGCLLCTPAESIPPENPYKIRTPTTVRLATTPEILEKDVEQAMPEGGWVPLVFHHICDKCAENSITIEDFTKFVEWLEKQPDTVVVRTVDQVIGGDVKPATGKVVYLDGEDKEAQTPRNASAKASTSKSPPPPASTSAAITILGVSIGQSLIIFVGLMMGLTAIITYRISTRGNRYANSNNHE